MFGYSQATRMGHTIYVAGTAGIGEGMHVPEPMAEQMELAYRNVAGMLAHFGASMSDVVEQRVYATSIDQAPPRWRYARPPTGGKNLPASSMVEVSGLALPQLKFEVAVVTRQDA